MNGQRATHILDVAVVVGVCVCALSFQSCVCDVLIVKKYPRRDVGLLFVLYIIYVNHSKCTPINPVQI